MEINDVRKIASEASALRRIVELEPIAGEGDAIAPARYKSGTAKFGDDLGIIVDSDQSQRNRAEEVFVAMERAGDLPTIKLDFGGKIYVASELPHRIADGHLRHAVSADGEPFEKSELYAQLSRANERDMRAVFEAHPVSALHGFWFSTFGGKDVRRGVGSATAANIVALDARPVKAPAVRRDPLFVGDADAKVEGKKLSELGLGSILSREGEDPPRYTAERIVRRSTLSLERLRQLDFGAGSDLARTARVVLWALGERGQPLTLRARCALRPKAPAPLQVLSGWEDTDLDAGALDALASLWPTMRVALVDVGFSTFAPGRESPVLKSVLSEKLEKLA